MKIDSNDLQNVPGATKRRAWLLDVAIDLFINLGEKLFGEVIEHIKEKRAERLNRKRKSN